MVQYVESLPEYKAIIESGGDKLIVVDFTASWCGPCKAIAPFYESLATKYPGVLLYKVDVDEAVEIAGECGIRAMPTFHFYKDGKKLDSCWRLHAVFHGITDYIVFSLQCLGKTKVLYTENRPPAYSSWKLIYMQMKVDEICGADKDKLEALVKKWDV